MFTPTRHKLTALAVVVVAAFAGSIAFWGPLFDLGFGETGAYEWTPRTWSLYAAPAGAALLGALFMLVPRFARLAKFGAFLVVAGGGWLLIGPLVSEFYLAEGVTFSTDATLASLLFHLVPGFLLTALGAYGIGISTWAREWRLHKEDTIVEAREHAQQETARQTLRREMEGDGEGPAEAAGDGTTQEHEAVDHKEEDRKLVSS